jgi:CheY-like chemotaxis protein
VVARRRRSDNAVTMDGTLHVLLVEDSAADTELIRRALRRGGFPAAELRQVDSEAKLRAALQERADWDVVLCDSAIPRLDVLEALSLVHGCRAGLPVLIVSGRREEELRELAASCGADGYLSKDSLADLPARLRECVPGLAALRRS